MLDSRFLCAMRLKETQQYLSMYDFLNTKHLYTQIVSEQNEQTTANNVSINQSINQKFYSEVKQMYKSKCNEKCQFL